jgi:hypothetical protein
MSRGIKAPASRIDRREDPEVIVFTTSSMTLKITVKEKGVTQEQQVKRKIRTWYQTISHVLLFISLV